MGRERKLPAGLFRRGKVYHRNFRAGGRRSPQSACRATWILPSRS